METASIPHLLILEPDARGHSREWIGHLIMGVQEAGARPLRLSIAVSPSLAAEIDRDVPPAAREYIRTVSLTDREMALCLSPRLAVSGMGRWWTMRRCLASSGATHGLFLELDHLSLPLALGLGAGSRPLSGILFRPSVHYGEIGPYRPTLRERLRDLRKALLYRLMMRNRSVNAVLSLDPYFVTYANRHYGAPGKVAEAPDPAFPVPEPLAGETALADAIPEDRRLLLLFGELTERKGLLTLLDALALLPSDDAARLAVVAGGRIEPEILDLVTQKADYLARMRPELWLHLENRRLSAGEIAALLHRSRMVLAPYQRFVGSSGILLWAARAGKPVLCQDYGLLGHLVRTHHLGVTVDSASAHALAEKLAAVARGQIPTEANTRAMAELCAARSPARFAHVVLERAVRGHGTSSSGTPLSLGQHGVLE